MVTYSVVERGTGRVIRTWRDEDLAIAEAEGLCRLSPLALGEFPYRVEYHADHGDGHATMAVVWPKHLCQVTDKIEILEGDWDLDRA